MQTQAGIPLTEEEIALVKSLRRLAKKWEKARTRLWLYSASGQLCVMLGEGNGNPHPETTGQGYNLDNLVETIEGIHNDGGDW